MGGFSGQPDPGPKRGHVLKIPKLSLLHARTGYPKKSWMDYNSLVEIYVWKQNSPERALEVLLANRVRFEEAFAKGLSVVGFERDAKGNGIYQTRR